MRIVFVLMLSQLIMVNSIESSESSIFAKGSRWFGGTLGIDKYKAEFYDEVGVMEIGLSTVTRFFPVKYLILGPTVNWNLMSLESENYGKEFYNAYEFGIDIGVGIPANKKFAPYLVLNPAFELWLWKYDSDDSKVSREPNFVCNVFTGALFFFTQNVGIQFEPSYRFDLSKIPVHRFSYSMGFVFCFNNNLFSASNLILRSIDG